MSNNPPLGLVLYWTKGNMMTCLTRSREKILRGLSCSLFILKLETKRRWSISAKDGFTQPNSVTSFELSEASVQPNCSISRQDLSSSGWSDDAKTTAEVAAREISHTMRPAIFCDPLKDCLFGVRVSGSRSCRRVNRPYRFASPISACKERTLDGFHCRVAE